jgi:hypothetical protein
MVATTPARAGAAVAGRCRAGVYTNVWEDLLINLGQQTFTRQHPTKGARDTTTGWYAMTWTDSDVNGVFRESGSSLIGLPAGVVCRTDAVFVCIDPMLSVDRLYDPRTALTYEVYGRPREAMDHEVGGFAYREVQLHLTELT